MSDSPSEISAASITSQRYQEWAIEYKNFLNRGLRIVQSEFWPYHRLPGSSPEIGITPGLATNRPQPRIEQSELVSFGSDMLGGADWLRVRAFHSSLLSCLQLMLQINQRLLAALDETLPGLVQIDNDGKDHGNRHY